MNMRACDYSVFRIRYKTTYAERVSTMGGMDSELTGKYITDECVYLAVAPDAAFATTAFQKYHHRDEFLGIENIGQLNDLVYLQ